MKKKSLVIFVIILVFGITIAIGLPVIAFGFGWSISDGFPLEWSSSFFGATTDYIALAIDIFFWFIIIWIAWTIFQKLWYQFRHLR